MGKRGIGIARGVAKALVGALIAVGAFAVAGASGLVLLQRHVIYPRAYGRSSVERPWPGWVREEMPSYEGGGFAWVRWSGGDAPTEIVFHGNAASLASVASVQQPWIGAGWNVVIPEYPGYGGASGEPSVASMVSSAHQAWRWMVDQGVVPNRVVIVGNSIGAGPASALAAAVRPAGLVLVSGVGRMDGVVAGVVGFPIGGLLYDRWDNVRSVREASVPTAVWEGSSDRLVGMEQATELAEAGGTAVRAVPGGHDVYWGSALQRHAEAAADAMVARRAAGPIDGQSASARR